MRIIDPSKVEKKEESGDSILKEKFEKLLSVSTRLQQLGYTDVFKDRREDIAYEVK